MIDESVQQTTTNRAMSRAAATTTMMALLAVAASATLASSSRMLATDGRVILSESQAMRLVAAAVAAARDLAGPETTQALSDPTEECGSIRPIGHPHLVGVIDAFDRRPAPLRPALLAIPPPMS